MMSDPGLAGLRPEDAAQSSGLIAFDIPAQSLEAALDAFGAASRMHVLYESELTSEQRSVAVKGSFPAEDALRLLLAGTKLSVRYTGPRSYTLIPMPQEANPAAATSAKAASFASAPRRQVLEFRHFLGGVQAGITARLCEDPRIRPGNYGIALRFWLSAAGAIQSPTMFRSSGDNARDAAIVESLSNLRFSEAPPVDMPQPVTMMVAPRTVAGSDCP